MSQLKLGTLRNAVMSFYHILFCTVVNSITSMTKNSVQHEQSTQGTLRQDVASTTTSLNIITKSPVIKFLNTLCAIISFNEVLPCLINLKAAKIKL